jgi:ankyrin repeat protein
MLTNSPEVVKCLLDNGADIENQADEGSTALEQACCIGNSAVVKILLKRGALGQMLKVDKQGRTPLSAAVNTGHEDVTLLLLQHLVLQSSFDINHPRLAQYQPLLCSAATKGLCKVAEFALDHGADPNITGPDGPPLFLAVRNAPVSMASLLCERGANVQTRFGPTNSLDQAILRCDAKVVKALIKHGADVNVVADRDHLPAVLQAAAFGECSIVQLLLDAGATLDAEMLFDAVTICCSEL